MTGGWEQVGLVFLAAFIAALVSSATTLINSRILSARHDERINNHDDKFKGVDVKFAEVTKTFAELDERFVPRRELEAKFDALMRSFEEVKTALRELRDKR